MRYVQAAILIVFLAAVGVFAIQNTQTVTVRFLNASLTCPLALLTIVTYLLGMLTGWTVIAFLRESIRRVARHRE
jgi:uncharacterized integral membrane protein